MQVRRAYAALRLRDFATVDGFLDTKPDAFVHGLEPAMKIAKLYAYRDRRIEALAIAYEARRRFSDDPSVHLDYMSIVINAERPDGPDPLLPDVVGDDTAVHIQDAGGTAEWYIIENRPDDRRPNEILPGHRLAASLFGHRAGDEVTVKQDEYVTEKVIIKAVTSKYVYAFQESGRTYQRLFPETPGMWTFRVGAPGSEPGLDDFQPLFDMITRQSEHSKQVFDLYRNNQLPLGVVSSLTGNDIIATWSRAMSPAIGLRSCSGVPADLADAKQLANASKRVAIDPISILTVQSLSCREALVDRFGKFLVAQSTVDWLHNAIYEQRHKPASGYMTVGRENGQFLRYDITPEDIDRHIALLERVQSWVDANCIVSPVDAALTYGRAHRDRFDEMMPTSFVDTLLLASGDDVTLYSDDMMLRMLANGEYSKKGVWTQALLDVMLDEKVITAEQYAGDVIQLASANYNLTHVSADVIMYAAEVADWRPVHPFSTIADSLSGLKCDEPSALFVATEVIYRITNQRLMDHQKAFLLNAVISSACRLRQPVRMLRALATRVQAKFRLHPFGASEALGAIEAWSIAHII